MAEENRLALLYGYLMHNELGLPEGLPCYFVGNPKKPSKGDLEFCVDSNKNLIRAVASAAQKSRELSVLVNMNFEGLARDRKMTLLLQPVQDDTADYKSVEELKSMYLSD